MSRTRRPNNPEARIVVTFTEAADPKALDDLVRALARQAAHDAWAAAKPSTDAIQGRTDYNAKRPRRAARD